MHLTKIMGDRIEGGGVYHRTFLKPLKLILHEPYESLMDNTIIINPSFVSLRNFMRSSCH